MTDLEFVRRCLGNDKQAWVEFIDKYSRLIYSSIYHVLKIKGVLLKQDSISDLFQEVFLSLIQDNFRKLRSFQAKNGCSLASWLRQVTVNLSIDYLRKVKIAVSLDEEYGEGEDLKNILVFNGSSGAEILTDKEKIMHLTQCIGQLSQEEKYLLELHMNQGLGLQELGDYLRISRQAVDMRKSRVMERLRECFKNKGYHIRGN